MDASFFDDLGTEGRDLICSSAIKLPECNSYSDLYKELQSTLISLLGADGIFITFFNSLSLETRIIVKSGSFKSISPNLTDQFKQIIVNNNTSLYIPTLGIVAVTPEEMCSHGSFNGGNAASLHTFIKNFKILVGIFNIPTPTVGLWVYKKECSTDIFSQHEINILKHIRPIIIQAIKSISFQDEKATYKQISEHFIASDNPTAIINTDGSILIKNMQFSEQLNIAKETKLPGRLYKQAGKLINQQHTSLAKKNISFSTNSGVIQVRRRLYEINITSITMSDNPELEIWLLTLTRVRNRKSQLSRTFEDANITRRETEVIHWLQKGASPSQVADNLGISYHTTKSHIKNIYKKLGISSARELLALGNSY